MDKRTASNLIALEATLDSVLFGKKDDEESPLNARNAAIATGAGAAAYGGKKVYDRYRVPGQFRRDVDTAKGAAARAGNTIAGKAREGYDAARAGIFRGGETVKRKAGEAAEAVRGAVSRGAEAAKSKVAGGLRAAADKMNPVARAGRMTAKALLRAGR